MTNTIRKIVFITLILIAGLTSKCQNFFWSHRGVTQAAIVLNSVTGSSFCSATASATATGEDITAKGIVYSTSTGPTLSDTQIESVSGSGSFSLSATTLTESTLYYFRAYITTAEGTIYSNEISYTTQGLPTAVTSEAINITETGAEITVTINKNSNTTTGIRLQVGASTRFYNGTGTSYTFVLNDLLSGTEYSYKAAAMTSCGTGTYTGLKYFTTLGATTAPTYTANTSSDTYEDCNIVSAGRNLTNNRIFSSYAGTTPDSVEIISFNPNADGDAYSVFDLRESYPDGTLITLPITIDVTSNNDAIYPNLEIQFNNIFDGPSRILCNNSPQTASFSFRVKDENGAWGSSQTFTYNVIYEEPAPTYDSNTRIVTELVNSCNTIETHWQYLPISQVLKNYTGAAYSEIEIQSFNNNADGDTYATWEFRQNASPYTQVSTYPLVISIEGLSDGGDIPGFHFWLNNNVGGTYITCVQIQKCSIQFRVKDVNGLWGEVRTYTAGFSADAP